MALAIYNGEVVGTGFVPTTIAPEFDSTKTYGINDLVLYMMQLYVFEEPKGIGAWDESKVRLTTIDELHYEDKTKLDGIEDNANNYVLPPASLENLGGVKADGTTIEIDEDGTIHAIGGGEGGTTNYNVLTNKPQVNGVELMGNKSLDELGIAPSEHTHTIEDITDFPTIPSKLSDLTNDSNFVEDENYVHTDNNFTKAEKDKLSGIADNANNYTLPQSTMVTLGGVKVDGTTITINEETGVISSTGGGICVYEEPATVNVGDIIQWLGETNEKFTIAHIYLAQAGDAPLNPYAWYCSDNNVTVYSNKIPSGVASLSPYDNVKTVSGMGNLDRIIVIDGESLFTYSRDESRDPSTIEWKDITPNSGQGGIDYSTKEQNTGQRWIDGKFIYQYTFSYIQEGTTVVADKGGNIYEYPINLNIDMPIKAEIIRQRNAGDSFFDIQCDDVCNIVLRNDNTFYFYGGGYNVWVTVFFTKNE